MEAGVITAGGVDGPSACAFTLALPVPISPAATRQKIKSLKDPFTFSFDMLILSRFNCLPPLIAAAPAFRSAR
jgi:hypothetical protein